MSSIETTFTFGTEVTFESLTIVPLLGTPSSGPDYDTLDAALARGTLHITEVSESGQVPEIKVLNEGQLPVLIIDGEELVGAKQNRTVNLSILVPPTANVIVPVTCVEAGRWSLKSRSFSSSSHTHFAAGRAAKSSHVSESLLRHGIARADQSQVWRDIEKKSARLQAHSATSAMSEIFERQKISCVDFPSWKIRSERCSSSTASRWGSISLTVRGRSACSCRRSCAATRSMRSTVAPILSRTTHHPRHVRR
jgi:ARG and Rhodanese-Phosphatase-superfamily-associated Protein domain